MSQKLLLKCTGKDKKEQVYNCIVEQDDCKEEIWHFNVFDERGELKEPSQMTVKRVCPETFQVTIPPFLSS